MIIVKLAGGLGNQMFQFAAGRALSLKHNTVLKVDCTFLEKPAEGAYTQRRLELDAFKAHIPAATEDEVVDIQKGKKGKFLRTIQRHFPFLFKSLWAVESGHGYHVPFENFPAHTYLDGYWQSEKYFKSIRSALLLDFMPRLGQPDSVQQMFQAITSSDCIGVHVRRGDYVNMASARDFHGSCDADYYKNAVRHIANGRACEAIFVFSDDIGWCKANLGFGLPTYFIEGNPPHWDLFLMSHCRHQVIANSSFSWWAAWLNVNPSKLVVMPAYWYAGVRSRDIDVVADGWEVLE